MATCLPAHGLKSIHTGLCSPSINTDPYQRIIGVCVARIAAVNQLLIKLQCPLRQLRSLTAGKGVKNSRRGVGVRL